MRDRPVYIVDEMEAVVSATEAEVLSALQTFDPNITGVHYYHGHPLEIVETLAQKDNSGTNLIFEKYPAVCLFEDIREHKAPRPGIYCTAPLHMAILYYTQPTFKSAERYTNTFKPVLYPIYTTLLQKIVEHKGIWQYDIEKMPHDKINRLYWGREGLYGNESNIFNDWVDAIEMQDLNLDFYYPNC